MIENNHNSLSSTFSMPAMVLGTLLILALILPSSCDIDTCIPILQIQN